MRGSVKNDTAVFRAGYYMTEKKNSIVEIAHRANVSIATVSRVINCAEGYSEKTKQKVLKAIRETGYSRNLSAVSLRTRKSMCIGVIVPDITNEYFARLIRELDNFFVRQKYTLLICDTNENKEKEQNQLRNLISRNVDAIIYISGRDILPEIDDADRPLIVYIDRCPQNAALLVQSDNITGGYLATKELLEKGCRHILFVRNKEAVSTIVGRKRGYVKALTEYGIPYSKTLELPTLPEYEAARRTLKKRLSAKALDFDGIFCSTDMIALGCVNALQEAGYRVPGDVKVVGFDNVSLSKFCNPPITTITQDSHTIAYTAGALIMDKLHRKFIKNTHISVPVALEKRKTT